MDLPHRHRRDVVLKLSIEVNHKTTLEADSDEEEMDQADWDQAILMYESLFKNMVEKTLRDRLYLGNDSTVQVTMTTALAKDKE